MARPRGTGNRPPLDVVERIAKEEADKCGLNPKVLFTGSRNRIIARVRRNAWSRVLEETRCSINGLADVWGHDPQPIYRHIRGCEA